MIQKTADLDSPRRELSNGGPVILVALLVRWQINVVCACTGGPIQDGSMLLNLLISFVGSQS